jgi:two-component system, cell cycle sensor histidine kinase and response regulator CckA
MAERQLLVEIASLRRRVQELEDIPAQVTSVEAALKEGEELLRVFSEAPFEAIFLSDKGVCIGQNLAAQKIFGYSNDESMGRNGVEWIAPESRDLVRCNMLAGYEEPYVAVALRKDGTTFPCEIQAKMLDYQGRRIRVTALRDITERKMAEDSLRESEQRYKSLYSLMRLMCDNVPDLIWAKDLERRFVFVNRAVCEKLLIAEDTTEPLGKDDMFFVQRERDAHSDNPNWHTFGEICVDSDSVVINNQEPQRFDEFGNVKGQFLYLDVYKAPFLNEQGEMIGTVGCGRDVTAERLREEKLRELDKKTRLLVEQSPVGIAIFQDGKYCYANPELVKIFGCESDDQILGEQMIRFVAPGHQRLFVERCKRHIEGKPGRPSYHVEGVKRNGELFDMVLWPRTIDYEGQPAILAFVMDVTETKNLREQLMRAQKMEAIGTLAGGIAHDFNNLLQVVVGYSQLMINNPALPDQFKRGIESIHKVALNGADLVGRLLTFARKTESSVEPLNLNDKIIQIRELLERTIPKMIQIELRLSKDPMLVNADPSQVEQIIMNLAVNAGHAMPVGGNLVIETQSVNIDKAYCLDHVEAIPGRYVLLSVSDTGTGIDKKTLERIFEPFFTTKGPGIGTGLGLSMVYGIVKQHGGHITCYSEPGAGTTLKIYFPAIDSEVKSEKPMDLVDPKMGTETILLVDDNESVRDLGEEMLLEYGYRVITASNGREALQIYSSERENISLVILDLFMPEMGGKECLRALLRMDPKVRVLLVSGFTQNGEIRDALDSGARGFIGKPVDIPKFLEEIRKIIDEE